jgi:hypothetical protein
MSTTDVRPRTSPSRFLRLSGVAVAVMWLVAMIITDGIQKGTTRNIISDPAAAQQTILGHQAVIVIESMTSFYLAGLVIVFAAALRHAIGQAVSSTAAFGGAVLAAVVVVLGGAVSFAELAAAHHHNVSALTTLGYLVAFAWAWEGAAWGFFLLAVAWAMFATKVAPRWFAIATVVLGIPVLLGVGAVLFWGLAPVWFVLVAFLLTPRADLASDGQVKAARISATNVSGASAARK